MRPTKLALRLAIEGIGKTVHLGLHNRTVQFPPLQFFPWSIDRHCFFVSLSRIRHRITAPGKGPERLAEKRLTDLSLHCIIRPNFLSSTPSLTICPYQVLLTLSSTT